MIEQSRFIPFSNEQLVCPQTDLSIEKHLVWITSEVLIKAKEDHVFQEVGRLTAGYDETFYYGQNVMINGYRVWFGYWPLAWRLHPAKGPLWMQYSGRDLKRFIHSFPEHSVHKIPDNEVALPVWVADANMSNTQEEEVENVLARIKDAVIRLKAVDPLVN